MHRWNRAAAWWVMAACAYAVAQPPSVPSGATAPAPLERDGFDAGRIARLGSVMQGFVDRGELPGLVLLVARDGRTVLQQALGRQDPSGTRPMTADTIFRIASMTKAVTSVAVLLLLEEGRLRLDDPLAKYVPAFKDVQVAVPGKEGEPPGSRRPARAITLHDLLTHRSGLSYGFNGDGPVQRAYRRLGVSDGLDAPGLTLAENVARLAQAPLVQDPGQAFHYGLSTDVLGRVVEVVSGQPLDEFFQARIFAPLKMVDTGFTVPAARRQRLAGVGTADGAGPGLRALRGPERFGQVQLDPAAITGGAPRYLSGGAGLASTASDYARFLQMLLNRGELEGIRILAPKTVDLMTASATRDLPPVAPGMGFGLGVAVLEDLGGGHQLGTPGMYGWSGLYGTWFMVDPKERLVLVLMTQRFPYGGLDWMGTFRTQVYAALVR